MGRMHAPGKGISQSALPYRRSVPTWLKLSPEDVKDQVPYLLVVGDKEVEAESLAIRDRSGNDLGVMSIEEFSVLLQQDVERLGRVDESTETA